MTPRTQVAVYGNSLLMAGIAASLQASPALEVMRIFSGPAGFAECLAGIEPAVVVFDPAEAPAALASAAAALRDRPGLLLIGIDPGTEQMLLWSGRRASVLSMQDLVRVITGAGAGSAAASHG